MDYRLIIAGVVIIILLVQIIKKRNEFMSLKAEVQNLLSDISNQKELRYMAITDAMEILGVAHGNDVDAIKGMNIQEMSKQLKVCGQMYPDLQGTPSYALALNKIQNFNEDITSAKNLLNKAIKEYNQAIGAFPANIVALILGYKRETFVDEDNMETNKAVEIGKVDYNKYKKN